jgi:hypothetical protein
MDLKKKIFEILEKEKYTFKELAEYVNMTEEDLSVALETKKLELRTLELMSKGLKIPLYSFFRSKYPFENKHEEPYYVNKLWEADETKDPMDLKEEIELLKEMLSKKENQLGKLK